MTEKEKRVKIHDTQSKYKLREVLKIDGAF